MGEKINIWLQKTIRDCSYRSPSERGYNRTWIIFKTLCVCTTILEINVLNQKNVKQKKPANNINDIPTKRHLNKFLYTFHMYLFTLCIKHIIHIIINIYGHNIWYVWYDQRDVTKFILLMLILGIKKQRTFYSLVCLLRTM